MQIVPATTAQDWDDAQRLVHDYLDGLPFEVDFQADVHDEVADLSTAYAAPDGVVLLVKDADGTAVGVVGVRRFGEHDGELKRMYLDPSTRGQGLGRTLAEAAIEVARSLGYRRLLLDTVSRLAPAVALYESLGFVDIDAYRFNPFDDARYFALELAQD